MMRIFELSTRITAISRGQGRSATAAAAYRACCAIQCTRENRLHDYTRKRGLEVSSIVAPARSPAWATDRSALWNAAELRERNGQRGPQAGQFKAKAKTAREFMFAFPAELSVVGRLQVAQTIARHLADTHGIVADFSIHQPGKDGDERNVHCHMLTTTRRMNAAGLGEKAREWDAFGSGAKLSKQFRAYLAATMNEALAAEDQAGAVFVEHRSFKDRGGTQRPQKHQGPGRTNAQRRAARQARAAWLAAHGQALRDRHARERAALAARQHGALQQKLAALADRAHRAAAPLDAPPAPAKLGIAQRLARVFGGTVAPKAAPPVTAARDQAQAAATAVLQAERTAYLAGQARERQTLDARQAAETRQLDTAASHRLAHDRLAEQQQRRDHGHDRADRHQDLERENRAQTRQH